MLEADGVEQRAPLRGLHPLELVLVDNDRVASEHARAQALGRLVGHLGLGVEVSTIL